MPATPIQPLITDAGLAAAIAAQGTGLTLQITHVQLGRAAYDVAPTAVWYARTALALPVESIPIAGGYRDAARFRVDALFEGYPGATYPVTEVGFWAGDPAAGGVLFAFWAQSTPFAQRNMLRYLATFNLVLSRVPYESVSVVIDPDLALALALVADHEAASNPHPTYVRHDAAQGLDAGHQAQARANIGAEVAGAAATHAGLPNPHPQYVRHDAAQGLAAGSQLQARQNIDAEQTGVAAAARAAMESDRVGTLALALGTSAPPGTVKAYGALLSRTTYARLWAYAQASGNIAASDAAWLAGDDAKYSPGDGATTFRIPDLRGYHLRMGDGGRGMVPGFEVGSKLADQNVAHTHGLTDPGHGHAATVNDPTHGHGVTDPGHAHSYTHVAETGVLEVDGHDTGSFRYESQAAAITGSSGTGISVNAAGTGITVGISTNGSNITVNSSGGTEVRVKAIAALPCIYY